MKYFVMSDIHGYYSLMMAALNEKGFDITNHDHKIIICGDLMDRAKEAIALQEFICKLIDLDKIILIRGNHEDLMLSMLQNFDNEKAKIAYDCSPHIHNGTYNTALQLAEYSDIEALLNPKEFTDSVSKTPFLSKIIPNSINYFETDKYIFVHGWIPCLVDSHRQVPIYYTRDVAHIYNSNWRNASEKEWGRARWINDINACMQLNIKEPNKTIVCGHWHSSYGHYHYGNAKSEMNEGANYSPYISDGIIAIDACTALSKQVNCIIIED